MFIGVFLYSFTIGSLSSILSKLEQKSIRYNTLLNKLIIIKKDFNINNSLYHRIKNHLKYGAKLDFFFFQESFF